MSFNNGPAAAHKKIILNQDERNNDNSPNSPLNSARSNKELSQREIDQSKEEDEGKAQKFAKLQPSDRGQQVGVSTVFAENQDRILEEKRREDQQVVDPMEINMDFAENQDKILEEKRREDLSLVDPNDIDIDISKDIEDDSDLIYDKELKKLLEDYKLISKIMMIASIIIFVGQIVFGLWCMKKLSDAGTWEDALLINWFHILKIALNAYISYTFFKRIKANQPSSPLGYISSYLTLFLYLGILFVFTGDLPPNIETKHVNLLCLYAASDILLMMFSWRIQRNIVDRRNELFKFKVAGITQEKKEYDLFDIRYLPEEYMSDMEDTSDEEEEEAPA